MISRLNLNEPYWYCSKAITTRTCNSFTEYNLIDLELSLEVIGKAVKSLLIASWNDLHKVFMCIYCVLKKARKQASLTAKS